MKIYTDNFPEVPIPLVAKEDIVAYKYCYLEKDGRLVAPFFKTYYEIGKELSAEFGRIRTCSTWDAHEVEKGLHTMCEKSQIAYDTLVWLRNNDLDAGVAVIKCIIPKGTRYFIGTWRDDKAYTSEKLIPIEIAETIMFEFAA